MDAAAQEQRVMIAAANFLPQALTEGSALQDLRELRWQAPQRLQQCNSARATAGARLGERHREQHQRGELGGEGFGEATPISGPRASGT